MKAKCNSSARLEVHLLDYKLWQVMVQTLSLTLYKQQQKKANKNCQEIEKNNF